MFRTVVDSLYEYYVGQSDVYLIYAYTTFREMALPPSLGCHY